MMKRK